LVQNTPSPLYHPGCGVFSPSFEDFRSTLSSPLRFIRFRSLLTAVRPRTKVYPASSHNAAFPPAAIRVQILFRRNRNLTPSLSVKIELPGPCPGNFPVPPFPTEQAPPARFALLHPPSPPMESSRALHRHTTPHGIPEPEPPPRSPAPFSRIFACPVPHSPVKANATASAVVLSPPVCVVPQVLDDLF